MTTPHPLTLKSAAAPGAGRPPLSLRRSLRQVFGLMLLLTLLAGGSLLLDLARAPLQAGTYAPEQATAAAQALETQTRARRGILGFTVLVLGGLVTTYLFVQRRLITPLERTAEVGRRMAEGHLDQTLPPVPPDEIGQINENMHALGINLQELIVLVWNQAGNSVRDLDLLRRGLPPQGSAEAAAGIDRLQADLGNMQRLVQAFDLYDVVLSGATAKAAPGVVADDTRHTAGAHKE
jgi:methyl-accepting chemotaxis protein